MIYTGERFVPDKEISLMALEHMHRYWLAAKYVQNRKCLDIASGEGYGSALLARSAASVVGCDIAPAAVKWAQSRYVKDNLEFMPADITRLGLKDAVFDVITCFETIEHISAAEQKKAIKELRRVLKNDGLLFISTPSTELDLHCRHNKFHKYEMTGKEFFSLLQSEFKYVKFLGQSIYCCSLITAAEGNGNILSFVPEQNSEIRPEECKYLLAICSNAVLPDFEKVSCCVDRSQNSLRLLTKIRNRVGFVLPLYNGMIQALSFLMPSSGLRKSIRRLKW